MVSSRSRRWLFRGSTAPNLFNTLRLLFRVQAQLPEPGRQPLGPQPFGFGPLVGFGPLPPLLVGLEPRLVGPEPRLLGPEPRLLGPEPRLLGPLLGFGPEPMLLVGPLFGFVGPSFILAEGDESSTIRADDRQVVTHLEPDAKPRAHPTRCRSDLDQ